MKSMCIATFSQVAGAALFHEEKYRKTTIFFFSILPFTFQLIEIPPQLCSRLFLSFRVNHFHLFPSLRWFFIKPSVLFQVSTGIRSVMPLTQVTFSPHIPNKVIFIPKLFALITLSLVGTWNTGKQMWLKELLKFCVLLPPNCYSFQIASHLWFLLWYIMYARPSFLILGKYNYYSLSPSRTPVYTISPCCFRVSRSINRTMRWENEWGRIMEGLKCQT